MANIDRENTDSEEEEDDGTNKISSKFNSINNTANLEVINYLASEHVLSLQ